MKYFKALLIIAAIASCCVLCFCDSTIFNRCQRDYTFDTYNNLHFIILNKKTKQNILEIGQTPYNYDTVNVYKNDWTAALKKPVEADGVISLQFIDGVKDKGVVDILISRRFYMYFNYQDIDTIDIAFEMKFDKCHIQVMKYFKVAYNDSVYYDGNPPSMTPDAGFIKK